MRAEPVDCLLSLPAAAARLFAGFDPDRARGLFVASDPPGVQLGSAGGTVHLLFSAWQAAATGDQPGDEGLFAWLGRSRKLIVHGSGESRRLPPYAAMGKPLTPIPFLPGLAGQRPDQTLLDLQLQCYRRLFWHAPAQYRVMVGCGDVLLKIEQWLPAFPECDVLIFGIEAPPEEAQRHGVLVCGADDPGSCLFFLQKPSIDALLSLGSSCSCYLDTGVWLLSERAVRTLMGKCGWDKTRQGFPGGSVRPCDLYAGIGPALGARPRVEDPDIHALRCGVVPLTQARFYHFGTARSLLASVGQLQRPASEQRSFGHESLDTKPPQVIRHATVQCPLTEANRHIWIENSDVPAGWSLAGENVLTGVPANEWQLALDSGVCLDFVPVAGGGFCFRPYGFEDPFRGPVGDEGTLWLGRPAPAWFAQRGIDWDQAGFGEDTDIHEAPLFPVLAHGETSSEFLTWMFSAHTEPSAACRRAWLTLPRLSAQEVLVRADLPALAAQRRAHLRRELTCASAEDWLDAAGRLDLAVTARLLAAEGWTVPPLPSRDPPRGIPAVHDLMFRFAADHQAGKPGADTHEAEAFATLRALMMEQMEARPVQPSRSVQDDQIVWGRAPVRFDLAGGWTDTPPYCIEHGGRVVNIAADLNGQCPIQVFARPCSEPEIVLRSIDLGIVDRIRTYDDVRQYAQLGSGFAIAKAALALAGFEPRFHTAGGHGSLATQLEKELGGGFDVTMLAAVPKGSGLGTSSILGAAILGTLGELCGLQWDEQEVFARTLAAEQMLTSGGGWQDQIGGMRAGVKLIETSPGLSQQAVIRGLPDGPFGPGPERERILLYYTGITRVAHDILGEIVRGLFLNAAEHMDVIREIGWNASYAADAIQRNDWSAICEAVRRSWHLNQRLDRDTNPPEVAAIVDRIADCTAACKLLGAGGGGYLLILARDAGAADALQRRLRDDPPNGRARFVDFKVSDVGFQVTRS